MSYYGRKNSTALTALAVIGVFAGTLVLIAVLALFEAWVALSIMNWAWPELPEFLSPTFEHICGVAVVLWVLQSTFKAKINKSDD